MWPILWALSCGSSTLGLIQTGTALYNKESADLVYSALKHGYTYLDAAQMYGNSASIGEALKRAGKRREDVYILTKCECYLN